MVAIREARALAQAHNDQAKCTQVGIFVLVGKIGSSDEEAARAIGDEVRSLIEGISQAIDKLDPDAIRTSASKAQALAAMLEAGQAERVGAAVEQARKAARAITKRIVNDAEPAAIVLADIQRGAIERARIAFLDLDAPAVLEGEPIPAIVARDLDLDVPAAADSDVVPAAPRALLDDEGEPSAQSAVDCTPVRSLDLSELAS